MNMQLVDRVARLAADELCSAKLLKEADFERAVAIVRQEMLAELISPEWPAGNPELRARRTRDSWVGSADAVSLAGGVAG